jgi:hypothetical protein
MVNSWMFFFFDVTAYSPRNRGSTQFVIREVLCVVAGRGSEVLNSFLFIINIVLRFFSRHLTSSSCCFKLF